MKILVTEVEMGKWKTVSYVRLSSEYSLTWEEGLKEYEICDYILETLKDQEVFGWIDGVNRFDNPVKRTYMLVPE